MAPWQIGMGFCVLRAAWHGWLVIFWSATSPIFFAPYHPLFSVATKKLTFVVVVVVGVVAVAVVNQQAYYLQVFQDPLDPQDPKDPHITPSTVLQYRRCYGSTLSIRFHALYTVPRSLYGSTISTVPRSCSLRFHALALYGSTISTVPRSRSLYGSTLSIRFHALYTVPRSLYGSTILTVPRSRSLRFHALYGSTISTVPRSRSLYGSTLSIRFHALYTVPRYRRFHALALYGSTISTVPALYGSTLIRNTQDPSDPLDSLDPRICPLQPPTDGSTPPFNLHCTGESKCKSWSHGINHGSIAKVFTKVLPVVLT
eukprot:scaffold1541_cov128-Amphora_coffeaeformis.AAC.1